jgi:hypothetical protein
MNTTLAFRNHRTVRIISKSDISIVQMFVFP